MPLANKFLWIVNMDKEATETAFAKHALAIGATGVCIRTSSTRLPGAIGRFKALRMKVYGWRWPGVIPGPSKNHYYALDEAKYVAGELIPNGLDGYIVDPESDGHVDKKTGAKLRNGWDQKSLTPIAFFFPIVTSAGFDPVWFGVIVVIMVVTRRCHAAHRRQRVRDRDDGQGGVDGRNLSWRLSVLDRLCRANRPNRFVSADMPFSPIAHVEGQASMPKRERAMLHLALSPSESASCHPPHYSPLVTIASRA